MKLIPKHIDFISLSVLSISVLVWILLLFNPGGIMTIEHCLVFSASGTQVPVSLYNFADIPLCNTTSVEPLASLLEMMLEANPFSSQLMGWGLMVLAMMLPKLIIPIQFVCDRSFKSYRLLSSLLFILGYLLSWMLAGVLMVAIIMVVNLLMPMSYLPALILLLIAIIWQFSPIKQRFLNRGHDHWPLSAFGWKARRDVLLFGMAHGMWCIGSGWALMLLPMLLPEGHNLAMLIVTFIMLSEHLEYPKYPEWNIDFRLRLFRIIFAQTKMKLGLL